jgi:hypothetical protein
MKVKIAIFISGTALGCTAITGCGGGSGNNTAPPATAPVVLTQQLDTAAVLNIVQTTTSETRFPFMVDGGLVTVTPADDETGSPINVDGT